MFTAIAITAAAVFAAVRGYYHREITVGRAFIKYINAKAEHSMAVVEQIVKADVQKTETEVKDVTTQAKEVAREEIDKFKKAL